MRRRTLLLPAHRVGRIAALAARAAARPPSSVTFAGHGYGHGRGMGQWGAYGYAVDHAWSWTQIVDHYYGGTTRIDPEHEPRATGPDAGQFRA